MVVLWMQSHWIQNLEYKLRFDLIEAQAQVSQSIDEEGRYVIWLFAAFISDIQGMIVYLASKTY